VQISYLRRLDAAMIKSSAVTRQRIERFCKNLVSALGHCVFEDGEVFGLAILALACIGVLWLVGMAVYEVIVNPHVTTAASLDLVSINPDKWISR
jgi:hypothetical protein